MNLSNELQDALKNMNLSNELLDAFKNYNIKTPRLTLNGFKVHGRLVDIIDGDSLTIVLPVFNNYYKFNVRLNGIDTSEIHSHNEELKQKALNTRNELVRVMIGDINTTNLKKSDIQDILDDKLTLVWVECLDFDKYGRLLANVYCFNDTSQKYDMCLSEYLLENKWAYKYNGGTKLNETEQMSIS